MGLNVAMWTVDTEANYLKYGKMGVYMMTCNSLKPNDMPELEDIDWGSDALEECTGATTTVNSTDYYTMTGTSLNKGQTAGGICIAVSHLSDGTIQTDKILEW